jgi:hypothetical protein
MSFGNNQSTYCQEPRDQRSTAATNEGRPLSNFMTYPLQDPYPVGICLGEQAETLQGKMLAVAHNSILMFRFTQYPQP